MKKQNFSLRLATLIAAITFIFSGSIFGQSDILDAASLDMIRDNCLQTDPIALVFDLDNAGNDTVLYIENITGRRKFNTFETDRKYKFSCVHEKTCFSCAPMDGEFHMQFMDQFENHLDDIYQASFIIYNPSGGDIIVSKFTDGVSNTVTGEVVTGGKKYTVQDFDSIVVSVPYNEYISSLDDLFVMDEVMLYHEDGHHCPTDINLSFDMVFENMPVGTLVGELITTDIDPAGSYSYSLVPGEGDTDNAKFSISGNQLLTAEVLSMAQTEYFIRIKTDDGACSIEKELDVQINNIEKTGNFDISFDPFPFSDPYIHHNQTYIGLTPSISGSYAGNISYSIGGIDVSLFSVDPLTGVVYMVGRDFNAPEDYDHNNIYEITLRAIDEYGKYDTYKYSVTVFPMSRDILDLGRLINITEDCFENSSIRINFNMDNQGNDTILVLDNVSGYRYYFTLVADKKYGFFAPDDRLCWYGSGGDGETHIRFTDHLGNIINNNYRLDFKIYNWMYHETDITIQAYREGVQVHEGGIGHDVNYADVGFYNFDSLVIISPYVEGHAMYYIDDVNFYPRPEIAAPTNLQISAFSKTKARLSWEDNSDNELGFIIERKETNCSSCGFEAIGEVSANATSSTTYYLEGDYSYRVKARGDYYYLYSECSNEVKISSAQLDIAIDKDAMLYNNTYPTSSSCANTNYGSYPQFKTWMWSQSGYSTYMKSVLDFDLSSVPDGAIITSATLYLYGLDHLNYTITNNTGYKSNESWLRRITSSWEENTVTWNTAPSITSLHETTVENSTSTTQDYEIDVVDLIQDIINDRSNSYGLMLHLKIYERYTRMVFASSDYSDANKHPHLEVTYYNIPGSPAVKSSRPTELVKEVVPGPEVYMIEDSIFGRVDVFPNPTDGTFTLEIENDLKGNIFVDINDISGRLMQSRVIEKTHLVENAEFIIQKSGIYLVTLRQGKHIFNKEVVVK
ncbi:MAG: DNRLRE domain-containing protein [Bacteroidales bacterium]|nr:DNRLRE domain-containing protein [Bacteroidales bacterium]